jgi:hypothetical protein
MSPKKKAKKLSLTHLVVVLVVALALIQLLISHRLATDGEMVKQLEAKATRIEKENVLLEEKLYQQASLINVAHRAKELGLSKTSDVWHLSSQIPVALKH